MPLVITGLSNFYTKNGGITFLGNKLLLHGATPQNTTVCCVLSHMHTTLRPPEENNPVVSHRACKLYLHSLRGELPTRLKVKPLTRHSKFITSLARSLMAKTILPVRLQEVLPDWIFPNQREEVAVGWQISRLMRTLRCRQTKPTSAANCSTLCLAYLSQPDSTTVGQEFKLRSSAIVHFSMSQSIRQI